TWSTMARDRGAHRLLRDFAPQGKVGCAHRRRRVVEQPGQSFHRKYAHAARRGVSMAFGEGHARGDASAFEPLYGSAGLVIAHLGAASEVRRPPTVVSELEGPFDVPLAVAAFD